MIKMRAKKTLVFFLALASVLLSLTVISAAEIANVSAVTIDGVDSGDNPSVDAGDTVPIKVYFEALENASNVRIKAEIEGDKTDVEARIGPFVLEDGQSYKKTLELEVPYELKDEVSDDLRLNIRIWDGDDETEEQITLRVQRPAYNSDVLSINADQNAEAGENVPVEVVLKNIGYNDLDDLYVTVKIPELGVKQTSYFGDVVAYECSQSTSTCDEDDEDTARGKFYLKIPYDATSGIYDLEVEVKNSDMTVTESTQISISNDFSAGNVIAVTPQKTFAAGQDATYELLLVNPTNDLKVYRIVPEASGALYSSTDQSVVAVEEGSSEKVTITANAGTQGIYEFNVNVFSGEELLETVKLSANVSGTSFTTPVAALTIILAVIFLVLLVVLIVLLGKKPAKETEEFGESYY